MHAYINTGLNLKMISIYKFHHCPSLLATMGFKPRPYRGVWVDAWVGVCNFVEWNYPAVWQVNTCRTMYTRSCIIHKFYKESWTCISLLPRGDISAVSAGTRCLSVCPSSVTFVDNVKTNKYIFEIFSQHHSSFSIPNVGTPLTRASNARGNEKMTIFDHSLYLHVPI